jgi:hypothetical protein
MRCSYSLFHSFLLSPTENQCPKVHRTNTHYKNSVHGKHYVKASTRLKRVRSNKRKVLDGLLRKDIHMPWGKSRSGWRWECNSNTLTMLHYMYVLLSLCSILQGQDSEAFWLNSHLMDEVRTRDRSRLTISKY